MKKGKQRELVSKEKLLLSWKEFSKKLNIKERKLLSYYQEESLIPEDLFNRLKYNYEFSEYVIEMREENWGKTKGGRISTGNTKSIQTPQESIELAEFYGIMLGDGNLTKIKDYKKGTYSARIVGDSRKDKKYLLTFVKPLIETLFGIKARTAVSKVSNAMIVEAVGKNIVDFLESKEFKPGDKIRNKLRIPEWIKQNPLYLSACLRGLYDTDGCIYKLTNQNSIQISFSNRNRGLLEDLREGLISLGIFPSKITKEKETNITKKTELAKFLKLLGFHNSKHLDKVKMWKIAPSSSGQIQ